MVSRRSGSTLIQCIVTGIAKHSGVRSKVVECVPNSKFQNTTSELSDSFANGATESLPRSWLIMVRSTPSTRSFMAMVSQCKVPKLPQNYDSFHVYSTHQFSSNWIAPKITEGLPDFDI